MKYLVANWKANKDLAEGLHWMEIFNGLITNNPAMKKAIAAGEIKIIVCPPSPLIYPLSRIDNSCLEFGSQDISAFENGTHTGEVTAAAIKGIASWTIVGHSERRREFEENTDIVGRKIALAAKYGIKTILCFSRPEEMLDADLKCYEPPSAISTGDGLGNNADKEEIAAVKKTITGLKDNFLYGGSVNESNISEYSDSGLVNGFLSGGASLDPLRFFNLAVNLLDPSAD